MWAANELEKEEEAPLANTLFLWPLRPEEKQQDLWQCKPLIRFRKGLFGNFLLAQHLKPGQTVKTDAFPALNVVKETQKHQKKITPPQNASEWLPLVHIVIGNMKTFINGTFHGVSSIHLQEYLDEFCYRFNRRFWEPELPMRLLNACLAHTPVRLAEFHL